MKSTSKGIYSSILGLVLSTACCWGPWVLILIGGSTGLLASTEWLSDFMPYLMPIGIFFFVRGIWKIFRLKKAKHEGNLPPCCRK